MPTDHEWVFDCDSEVPMETLNPRENTSSLTEWSDEIKLRQGSITHPYRSLMNENGFPRCHRVTVPPHSTESYNMQIYTRSMLRQGNGTPVWDPIGYGSEDLIQAKNSLSIGDVGYFHENGSFEYHFNIFLPSTHPAQFQCPPDFEPLSPPLQPTELVTNETHFPPGTTLVSPGVDVSCMSSDPLDMTFTFRVREAGILIMPEGGARMDLTPEAASRVRDYALKHVREWYRLLNSGSIHTLMLCPNASICVITGHDKAPSWALGAAHPFNFIGKLRSISYNPKGRWTHCPGVSTQAYKTTAEYTDHCAVFLRTMRFALGQKDWVEYLLENEPIDIVGFYYVPTVPVLGLRARYQTLKERIFKKSSRSVSDECCETIFHPLVVVLQFLLAHSSISSTTVIEDSVWNAVASKCDGSLSSTIHALVKLLETHQICHGGGYVTLKSSSIPFFDAGASTSSTHRKFNFKVLNILSILSSSLQNYRRHRYIKSKLLQVFLGPSVPPVFLIPLPKPPY